MSASTFTGVIPDYDSDPAMWSSKTYDLPEGSYEPGLRLMHGGAEEKKSPMSSFWGWVTGGLAKAWSWVKQTLHLQGAMDWTKATFMKGVGYARSTVSALGWSGVGGFGLLTISTKAGRMVLHYLVGVPIGGVTKGIGWSWVKTENFFSDNLGSFGTWIADRMTSVDTWLYGVDGVHGVVGTVTGWYIANIKSHLHLDSIAMRSVRLAGTMLFGVQVIAALPLLLAGSALTAVAYVVWVGLFATTCYQAWKLGHVVGSNPSFAKWLKSTEGKSRKGGKPVTPINVSTLKDDVATAVGSPSVPVRRPSQPDLNATRPGSK